MEIIFRLIFGLLFLGLVTFTTLLFGFGGFLFSVALVFIIFWAING